MTSQLKRRLMLIIHDVLVHPIIGVIKALSPSTRPRFAGWLHDLTVPPFNNQDQQFIDNATDENKQT